MFPSFLPSTRRGIGGPSEMIEWFLEHGIYERNVLSLLSDIDRVFPNHPQLASQKAVIGTGRVGVVWFIVVIVNGFWTCLVQSDLTGGREERAVRTWF